ncbi:MAG: acyl-CoA dehydrogenase family protein [Candidatus Rokubacteria bacterium]|nr:acyl-CoA dehydrogenase family protein [Candidatus Rokubacteria bacterium]
MSVTETGESRRIDEREYRALCRTFAEREIAPRWAEADSAAEFPRAFYEAAAQAGFVGVTFPPALGGAGLGCTEEAVFLEEASRVNPNFAVAILVQYVAGSVLARFGTAEQRRLAADNAAGKCLLALTLTEPGAGNDIQAVATTARRDGDAWVLNGLKAFITLGGVADVLLVLARTDSDRGRAGMTFFAVDRDTPGIVTTKMGTWVNRPAPTYKVAFDDARVPDTRRLTAGFRELMEAFNRERILVAARWLGHMQHALDWAVRYARERHQFGRPIGSYQSIAFQLAQAHVDVEATRRLTYHAARRWDDGVPLAELILDVSSAKLFATQAVVRVTQTALHVAGGWGVTDELPAMRMALDALVAPVTVGSWEIQLRAIARRMGLPCD